MIYTNISYFITILFLIILSIIDIKTYKLKEGYIPAVITTLFMILSFYFSLLIQSNITTINALFGLLIGLLFIDLNLYEGLADLKVIIACSMVLPGIKSILFFALTISMITAFTSFLLLKTTKEKEIPYITIIATSYILTLVGVIY